MMPLSVAHGWKVTCVAEVALDVVRPRTEVSLNVVRPRAEVSLNAALSRTRRAVPMSLPNWCSVGGSPSPILPN